MSNYYNARSNHINTFRSTSSSLLTAPSWSLGIGASESQLRASCFNSDDDESETRTEQCSPSQNNINGISTASGNGRNDALDQVDAKTSTIARPCISSIEIPTVFLKRDDPNKSSYHVYQVTITSKTGEQWSIYRRYSQFHSLHHRMKSLDSRIKKIKFPPKRRINSKSSNIVQDRQRKLEGYLNQLEHYIQRLPLSSDGIQQDTNSRLVQATNGVLQPATSSRASFSTSDSVTCDGEDNSSSDFDLNQLLSERSSSLGDRDELEPVELAQLALPDDGDVGGSEECSQPTEAPDVEKSSVRSIFYEFVCFDSKRNEDLEACDSQNGSGSGGGGGDEDDAASDKVGTVSGLDSSSGSGEANQTIMNSRNDV